MFETVLRRWVQAGHGTVKVGVKRFTGFDVNGVHYRGGKHPEVTMKPGDVIAMPYGGTWYEMEFRHTNDWVSSFVLSRFSCTERRVSRTIVEYTRGKRLSRDPFNIALVRPWGSIEEYDRE